jgi:hypothetical protein
MAGRLPAPRPRGGEGGDATATVTSGATNSTAASEASAYSRAGSGGGSTGVGFAGFAGAADSTATAGADNGYQAKASAAAQNGYDNEADSTATTSLTSAGLTSVQAKASPDSAHDASSTAIADVGSGQSFVNHGQTAYSFGTGLPDSFYLAGLVPDPSHVYDALIAPIDSLVLGAGIIGANHGNFSDSETYGGQIEYDFANAPGGQLYLGLIDGQFTGFDAGTDFDFYVDVNGTQVFDCDSDPSCQSDTTAFFDDDVILLGPATGPGLDIVVGYDFTGDGSSGFSADFIVGSVPEPPSSTLLLAAGLIFGWRLHRRAQSLT